MGKKNEADVNEQRFNYAWKWFSLHAEQRGNLFNYFLVITGILINGYVISLKDDLFILSMAICVLGIMVGVGFLVFDLRNRQLISYAEDILEKLEREYLFKEDFVHWENGEKRLGLVLQDSFNKMRENQGKTISFRKLRKMKWWIRIMQIIVIITFLFGLIYVFIKKHTIDDKLNNLNSCYMENHIDQTKLVNVDDLDCPYCIEFIYRKPKPILNTIGYPYQDRILYENEHAFVVPTIGSITPNYLLIIPKRHVISCKDLSTEEIESLMQCKEKIEYNVGSGTIFEHGSFSGQKSGGASIEHAHLHFIPVEIDQSIIPNKPEFKQIKSIAELNSINSEYLLIWNKSGIYYTKSESVPSQFLRKVIAKYFGVPDKWNWKEFPFVENMQHTYTSWKKFY